MSSTEDSCQLKAGHPPAVKAGGMRITQHKTTHTERPPKDAEDVTGLTVSSSTPNTVTVSGAVVKGNADFSPEAAQAAHAPKPPVQHSQKPIAHIQQPRK
uniref:Putative death-associated protein n=1 Tax=Xenopsylla cheopis TaxID=163159 RepID=A0A6M2DLB5_XENCH